ncbi:MAG TPA: hypothetical protein VN952_09570 [Chthoniobacterales bacterium]|jgi:hypothetical protein|nr:hypothetical protein [Chthoniobacterales bacterium]
MNAIAKKETTLPFSSNVEQQTCTVLLGLLLFAWFVFSVTTAILLIALYLPHQDGLSALFQALGYLLPADPVIYAT